MWFSCKGFPNKLYIVLAKSIGSRRWMQRLYQFQQQKIDCFAERMRQLLLLPVSDNKADACAAV